MNQSQVDISVSVGSGVIDSGALELARSLLAGYSGEYIAFQHDDDEFILCLSDSIEFDLSTGHIIVGESDWYDITITENSSTVTVYESGTASGGFGGYQNAGQFSGNYSGSFPVTVREPSSYQIFYYHDADGVELENPNNYAVFSSMSDTPKLIEGGTYYAFAQTAILCVLCLFVLFDRIFKHVH